MEQKTAHHYLEEIGWGSYNLKVFLQCGVVSFKQAWTTDMLWSANVAYILVGAKDEFNLTGVQTGILGAGFPLGLMIGAFYWGLTGDKYGRMYAFKNTVSVASMFSLVLTFACTPWIVVASLFFLGFGMAGELSLGGTVFLEFCPPSKHYLLTRMALFWGLGGTLSALTALVIILINVSVIPAWRLISGIGFLIEAVCACFRFSLEETPAFHHEAGNLEHMENVLNNISMENNANEFNLMKRNNPDGFDEREPQAMHMIKKLFKGKHLVSTLSFALVRFR
jgi:MFS family permease